EYVKALQALGEDDISVLSRRQESADALAKTYGLKAAHGGGEATLATCMNAYDAFIVATPIEMLPGYAAQLAGAKRVLLEKPCFLSSGQLKQFLRDHPGCTANVALNRLYYPSVTALAETLAKD